MGRLILISLVLVNVFLTAVLAQTQTPKSIPLSGFPPALGYLEYLPPNYQTDAGPFPVLIYLHGGGEAGDGSPGALENVKVWGPPSHIEKGNDMCFTVNEKQECFIVISPQINSDIYKWEGFVSILIDHILHGPENYNVDPSRIYLTGISRGGVGVYSYASHIFYNRPNRLAAIAPISTLAEDYADGCLISSRQIPVWAFHGKEDTVVPYPFGTSAFNSILLCTNPEPVAELIFTTYENDGKYHDAWIPAYDTSHKYHDPNLYEWLLMQTRPEITVGTETTVKPSAAFSIFPNPSSDVINIEGGREELVRVTISDLTGRQLKSIEKRPEHPVNISTFPRGAYIIELESFSGQRKTIRFIKTD